MIAVEGKASALHIVETVMVSSDSMHEPILRVEAKCGTNFYTRCLMARTADAAKFNAAYCPACYPVTTPDATRGGGG